MFKLVVFTALFALAAAKPSYLHAPAVIAAPITKTIVQPPPVVVQSTAHVGSVVSSIPAGYSSHSSSVVHSTGAVVTPVVTPIQKTIVAAPVVAAPIYKTYAAAPIIKTYAAAPAYSYHASPIAYGAYSAPLSYHHGPLAYSAPALW